MYYRFHFVGATFGQHEFIRNLQYLSYSTSVTLILRKSSLALQARKAHNSLAQLATIRGLDGDVSSVSPLSEGTAYNLAYFC